MFLISLYATPLHFIFQHWTYKLNFYFIAPVNQMSMLRNKLKTFDFFFFVFMSRLETCLKYNDNL
jgi:hypothetical protein